jgi:hypothetical protein
MPVIYVEDEELNPVMLVVSDMQTAEVEECTGRIVDAKSSCTGRIHGVSL